MLRLHQESGKRSPRERLVLMVGQDDKGGHADPAAGRLPARAGCGLFDDEDLRNGYDIGSTSTVSPMVVSQTSFLHIGTKSMTYTPQPIDTSSIPLSESLAAHAHDVWARQRIGQDWTYGPQRNDELK